MIPKICMKVIIVSKEEMQNEKEVTETALFIPPLPFYHTVHTTQYSPMTPLPAPNCNING